jgi:hypothetical protein
MPLPSYSRFFSAACALLVLLCAHIAFAADAHPAAAAPPASAPAIETQPLENFRYTVAFEIIDEEGKNLRSLPPVHCIFLGDRVVAVDKDDVARMSANLKTPSIRGPRGNGGTLEELHRKLEIQRKRVLEKIDDFKDPQRMKVLYDPQLKSEQTGNMLKLTNPLMTYEIELTPIAEPQRHRLYLLQRLQDHLNTTMDSPPFASLAVTDELEKRQSYGRVMTVHMLAVGGAMQHIRSTFTFAPLSDEELKKYSAMLEAK